MTVHLCRWPRISAYMGDKWEVHLLFILYWSLLHFCEIGCWFSECPESIFWLLVQYSYWSSGGSAQLCCAWFHRKLFCYQRLERWDLLLQESFYTIEYPYYFLNEETLIYLSHICSQFCLLLPVWFPSPGSFSDSAMI